MFALYFCVRVFLLFFVGGVCEGAGQCLQCDVPLTGIVQSRRNAMQ